jgi:hypothetical protein
MSREPTNQQPHDAPEKGRPKSGKTSGFSGILKREGQPTLTIDEINDVIERGWAGLDREDSD